MNQGRLDQPSPSSAAHLDQASAPRQRLPDQLHPYSIRKPAAQPDHLAPAHRHAASAAQRQRPLLTYTGRRTGRQHTLPVQYARWPPRCWPSPAGWSRPRARRGWGRRT
jgi:hypothetical protein